jgi:hypothetical protein
MPPEAGTTYRAVGRGDSPPSLLHFRTPPQICAPGRRGFGLA